MTYCKLWREIARRGWEISFSTAFMFGERDQGSIGMEVMLDTAPNDKSVAADAVIVHHEEMQEADAILNAALRLCLERDPEFG